MDITTEINPKHKSIINTLTIEQKCEVQYDLNIWQWNNLLGDKPEGWDDLPNYNGKPNKFEIVDPIFKYIMKIVPNRKIIRYNDKRIFEEKSNSNENFYVWHYKRMIGNFFCKIINCFGIYTRRQKCMYQILMEVKEKEHQKEMNHKYR